MQRKNSLTTRVLRDQRAMLEPSANAGGTESAALEVPA